MKINIYSINSHRYREKNRNILFYHYDIFSSYYHNMFFSAYYFYKIMSCFTSANRPVTAHTFFFWWKCLLDAFRLVPYFQIIRWTTKWYILRYETPKIVCPRICRGLETVKISSYFWLYFFLTLPFFFPLDCLFRELHVLIIYILPH